MRKPSSKSVGNCLCAVPGTLRIGPVVDEGYHLTVEYGGLLQNSFLQQPNFCALSIPIPSQALSGWSMWFLWGVFCNTPLFGAEAGCFAS